MTAMALERTHFHKLTRYERIKSRSVLSCLFPDKSKPSKSAESRPTPSTALVYPVKIVWYASDREEGEPPARIMISIPKRRLHQAVDRVKMRRRIRESFRLLKDRTFNPDSKKVFNIAIIFVSDKTETYADVNRSIEKGLHKILVRSGECRRKS